MATKLAEIPLGKLRLVDTLDLRERGIKRRYFVLSFRIAMASSPLFILAIIILSIGRTFSYPEFFLSLLIALALIAPIYVLHELLHFVFQWGFSHKVPRLSLKPPWPYSALAVGAHISRQQGVICALSPFLLITLILVLLSLAPNPQVKATLLIAAFLHAPTCAADFLLISWLYKHPKHLRYGTVDLANALFEPPDYIV